MLRVRWAACGLLVAVIAACAGAQGGGGGTGESGAQASTVAPTATVVNVTSAATGGAVARATATLGGQAAGAVTAGVGCAVTEPPVPAFVPPPAWPAKPPYAGDFWYGSEAFWVLLEKNGTWQGLPHSRTGYTQKVFWFHPDYHPVAEPKPALTVRGRRLDAEAPEFTVTDATNASADFGQAMLTGVDIPEAGCWRLTGRYRGNELSFVVRVLP